MRHRFLGVVAGLFVLAACGPQCAAQPASSPAAYNGCNRNNGPHYGYVVVEHMSGVRLQTCVNFTPSFIGAETALTRAKVEFQTTQIGGATVMCQLDLEPASVSGCGGPVRARWVTFVSTGSQWRQVGEDVAAIRLYNDQAVAWRYIAAAAPVSPPPHL